MRHAVHLPPFGPLADPGALIEIAEAADERGWDGLFLWDHILSPVDGDWDISDVWTVLGAIAARTGRLRLGPMVTPVPRRRIMSLAQQAVTLDRLSAGRLTLGLGFGSNRSGEFTKLGEETDPRARAAALDEGLRVLTRLWAGETLTDAASDHPLTDVVLAPGPVQRPRIPIWIAVTNTDPRPIDRAAAHDGAVLTDIGRDATARVIETLSKRHPSTEHFDIAVPTHRRGLDPEELESLGATWALHSFWPGHTPDRVLRHLESGPPGVPS